MKGDIKVDIKVELTVSDGAAARITEACLSVIRRREERRC